MKKVIFNFIALFMLLIAFPLFAQMGINNNNPQATLDIVSQGNNSSTKALRITNTTGAEVITLTDDGRIGVNRTNPDAMLHVQGGANGIISERAATGSNSPAYVTLRKNRSNDPNINGAVLSGDAIGSIVFSGNTGNGYTGNSLTSNATITVKAAQDYTVTAKGNYMEFSTVPIGSATSAVRMRIEGNGFVGIGRIAATNRLEVEGEASKTNAGAWLGNSDARLKKDIQPISGEEALNKLTQLQGVYYYWNDDKTGTERPKERQIGFTAQNIQEVFPEKVKTDKLGYLQTAYGDYDAIFVEAIKTLNDRIKEIKTRIDNLKKDNTNLNRHN